jgi:hypothetical protein
MYSPPQSGASGPGVLSLRASSVHDERAPRWCVRSRRGVSSIRCGSAVEAPLYEFLHARGGAAGMLASPVPGVKYLGSEPRGTRP